MHIFYLFLLILGANKKFTNSISFFKSFIFRSDALLSSLNCAGSCDRIVVNSDGPAAVWQNKRTGLFKFIGEHNGRPVYQNNATKEFLFYTTVGSEWLVGPDFRKPHAGIQVSGQSPSALIWSKHSVSYFLCQNIFKFFLRLFFCA